MPIITNQYVVKVCTCTPLFSKALEIHHIVTRFQACIATVAVPTTTERRDRFQACIIIYCFCPKATDERRHKFQACILIYCFCPSATDEQRDRFQACINYLLFLLQGDR